MPDGPGWKGSICLKRIDLPKVEKLLLRQNLQLLKATEETLAEIDQLLARLAQEDERVPMLMQIPGINVFGALAILAGIRGITRFANPKKPPSHAGLAPSLHRSGRRTAPAPSLKRGDPACVG